MLNIPEYNQIDVEQDTKEVIQSKIETLKKALAEGKITIIEYEEEQARVEGAIAVKKLGYAFSW